jgi:hypothetical protein
LLDGYHALHQRDQVIVEKRIQSAVTNTPRLTTLDLDRVEADPLKFLDEVTLRQGPGHSAGPSGRMGEDLGWERVLLHRDV